jgi:hypothetical protein
MVVILTSFPTILELAFARTWSALRRSATTEDFVTIGELRCADSTLARLDAEEELLDSRSNFAFLGVLNLLCDLMTK